MDKNDIIEYVMNTPHNTNRAVLSGMLNQLTGGGGGGGAEPLIVNYTWNDNLETYVLDKTAGELKTAFESGTAVFIRSVEISEGWSESTKTAMINGVETLQQAGETEGEFKSFYITFSTITVGDMVADSSISIEDALTKYPHSQG